MTSRCPWSVGLLEITPWGHPPPVPELLVSRGDGTPHDGAVVHLDHRGMLLPAPSSLRTDPGAGWGVPRGLVQGGAVWRGRSLHLPCPCPHPRSLSKHPVPPQCPFWWQKAGRSPQLSPSPPRQQPHTASPAPQAEPVGAGELPQSGAEPRPQPPGRAVRAETSAGCGAGHAAPAPRPPGGPGPSGGAPRLASPRRGPRLQGSVLDPPRDGSALSAAPRPIPPCCPRTPHPGARGPPAPASALP